MHPTQPPLPPPPSGGPSTREIPVVQPAHTPTTTAPTTQQFPAQPASAAAAAAAQGQPTGPVDYVPGPPPAGPAGTGAPSPAAGGASAGTAAASVDFLHELLEEEPRHPDPHARARLAGAGLAVLALGVLQLGLLADAGGRLWSQIPLWAGFASLAGLVALVALAGPLAGVRRLGPGSRTVALAGFAGLAVFWLLVVLPSAGSDRGFLLTAALGCLGAATWLGGRG